MNRAHAQVINPMRIRFSPDAHVIQPDAHVMQCRARVFSPSAER
jgi:hypothetical protein